MEGVKCKNRSSKETVGYYEGWEKTEVAAIDLAWQPLADQDGFNEPSRVGLEENCMYTYICAVVTTKNYSLWKLFSITSPFSLYPFFSNNFECRNGVVS